MPVAKVRNQKTMQYLFLIYADGQQPQAISESGNEAYDRACLANDQALRERGYLLFAVRLQNDGFATTVRVQNGELSLTGGPFSGTEPPLVGIFFVNARDLNEAIRLASKMPQAQYGAIEVRSAIALFAPSISAE